MKRYIYSIILLIVIGVVGYFSFADSEDAPDSLKIGLISILSGDYAAVGENVLKGFLLAEKEYEQNNPGTQIDVVVEDDGYNSRKGVSAYRKLIDVDKIDVLFNVSSPTINGIYDDVVTRNFPVIQGGEQGEDPVDDNIFQIMPGNIDLEVKLGKYVQDLKERKPALLYSNDPTYTKFATAFKRGYGGEIEEFIAPSNNQDIRSFATKVKQSDPSAVVYIGLPTTGALIVKELLAMLPENVAFIFDGSFQTAATDYERILGDLSVLEGAVIMGLKVTSDEAFAERYRAEYGVDPGFLSAEGYDAFNILVESYHPDGARWIQNVRDISTLGVSGRVDFDDVGVRLPDTELKTVRNGVVVKK